LSGMKKKFRRMRSQMNRLLSAVVLMAVCSGISLAQKTVTAVEYSIFSVVLNSIDRDYRKDNNGETQHYLILTELFDSRKQEASASGRKLANGLWGKPKHSLVDESEVKGLIEKGRIEFEEAVNKARLESKPYPGGMCGESIWNHFHSTYPDSNGYYQFSNVRFDRRKQRATIEVKGKGAVWDSQTTYCLVRTRRGWRIQSYGGGLSIC
jgi:hypothetical protein